MTPTVQGRLNYFVSPRGTARGRRGSGGGILEWWLRLAATAALLATTACSTRSELNYATLTSEAPVTKAIAVPPPGGPAILAVLQRNYQNGLSQEIALSTTAGAAGQNAFYVSLMNSIVTRS